MICGVSLLLINSEKGKEIFKELKEECKYKKCDVEKCLQHNLKQPTKRPQRQKEFWKDYEKHGYAYLAKKYGLVGIKSMAINKFQILLYKIRFILGGSDGN